MVKNSLEKIPNVLVRNTLFPLHGGGRSHAQKEDYDGGDEDAQALDGARIARLLAVTS